MRLAALQVLLLWGLAVVLGLESARPPPVRSPEEAGEEGFSAVRAMAHVEVLAAAPRPVGAAAHAQARAYLAAQLRGLGWQVEEQAGLSTMSRWGALWVVPTHNLLARWPGALPAVLAVSHYDSVPTGPGAGDAAAPVAALLETARALSVSRGGEEGAEIRLLFTDAEELGLLGARAFLASDATDLAEVRAVLNHEARGNAGPSILFETSEDNAALIDAFAQVPRPLGNSLAYELYRLLPNDTDFSAFQRQGAPGLNFAFLDGFPHYHAPTDRPERLDPRSVQHQGETMLSLVRTLAAPVPAGTSAREGNVIFFSLPGGGGVVRYPSAWALPLGLLGLLALLAAVARHRLPVRALASGLGLALLAVLAAAGVGLLGGLALGRFLPEAAGVAAPTVYTDGPWRVLLMLAACGAALAIAGMASDRRALLAGGALLWSLLGLVLAAFLPGASYLFFWPALGLTLSLWPSSSSGDARVRALGALPALVLVSPVAALLFPTLGFAAGAVAGLLGGLAVVAAVPLLPLASGSVAGRRWGLGAMLAALLLSPLAVNWAPFSERHPRQDGLVYWHDLDSGEARWSRTLRAGPWTEALFAGAAPAPTPPVPFLWSDVETVVAAPSSAPLLRITEGPQRQEGGLAAVTLQAPASGAILLGLRLDPRRVSALWLDGHPVPLPSASEEVEVLFFGPLWSGVQVQAQAVGEAPVPVQVRAVVFGLPGEVVRPAEAVATPWGLGTTDMIVEERRLSL